MKIRPVLTEKSMTDAKNGKYTFMVPVDFNKFQIRELIGIAFKVKVKDVRTQSRKASVKTTLSRSKVKVKATKKATVKLSGKETIDIFDTETKKAKKKGKK